MDAVVGGVVVVDAVVGVVLLELGGPPGSEDESTAIGDELHAARSIVMLTTATSHRPLVPAGLMVGRQRKTGYP